MDGETESQSKKFAHHPEKERQSAEGPGTTA